MQEGGGVTPGRKPVTRTIEKTKKKPKKFFLKKPTKRTVKNPPKDGNGESDRAWWDFLGWAGTGSEETKMGEGGKQLVTKIADVDKEFAKNDFFGPIITATSKIILGEKPDSTDFNNVGRGINLLINEGLGDERIAKGMIGYQSGGVVDTPPPFLDVESWVQESFKKASNKVSETKPPSTTSFGTTGPEGEGEYDSATGEFTGSGTSPGTASGAIAASDLYKKIGANAEQWDIFRNSVALIESGGDYSVPGGSGMHYDGRYQMGAAAKTDGSKYAGVPDPGHSDDPNAQVRAAYRANKELQETIFTGFTLANHTYLMGNETYKNSSIERKLEILGYAHNQGMGGAENWMTTGVVGADGFGTKGTKYTDLIAANFRAKKSGGELELADNAISVPSLPDTPGDTDTSSGGDISVSGSNIVNIGKDLASKGFAVAEHPDFTKDTSGGRYTPGKGYVSNVHRGDGHYQGRAIDVTQHKGGDPEYKQTYLPVLNSLVNNPAIKMLIHDTWGFYKDGKKSGPGSHGHPQHMHIEVKDKGGFIGKGLFANLGGTEFVTDADSTAALKQVAPGLMMALNQARDSKGVESALQQYASYEQGAAQTIMIDDSSEDMSAMSEDQSPMPSFVMPSGSNTYDNSFDFLDYQG